MQPLALHDEELVDEIPLVALPTYGDPERTETFSFTPREWPRPDADTAVPPASREWTSELPASVEAGPRVALWLRPELMMFSAGAGMVLGAMTMAAWTALHLLS